MSLRVWLPLNGDLRNNGLSNAVITNNGTTVDNNGKIGKCYSFDGTHYIDTGFYEDFGTGDFTLCAWIYLSKVSGKTYQAIISNKTTTGKSVGCAIYWHQDQKKFLWSTADGNASTEIWSSDTFDTVVYDSWHHIAMIRNNSDSKKGYFYFDGVRKEIASIPAIRDISNSNYTLKVGALNPMTAAYTYTGKINDVRIYDHALSAKEVKELSKGLVCHYPLNDIKGQENLFNWGNKGNEIITLNNYQNTGSFTQFTNCLTFDAKDTVGTTYTISFWAKSPNGTTSLLLYNNNSTPRYFYFSTTLTTSLNNEWQYFTYTFTNQDRGSGTTTASTYNRIEIYMPSQMGGQVKLIKIEEGNKATIWSPAPSDIYYNKLGYDKNIICDTSGNGYNMTINGTPTCNTDTPRNSTCIDFVSPSNAYCTTFNPTGYTNSYSIAFWAVYTNNGMAFAHANGNRLNLWFNSGKILWNTGDSANNPFQNNGTDISNTPYRDSWHHYVITADGTSNKLYIDGEYVGTAKTFRPLTGTTLVLSGWTTDTSTSYRLNSSISDFRLYSTTLSEDDIKELYNTPISIAKNGSILTQGEYIE